MAAAATSATNDLADAGLTLAQSLNGAVTGFLNAATAAGKSLADTAVTEGVALANSIPGLVTGFTHSYISAAVGHTQDVANVSRTAAKNSDSALTGFASGVAGEQHDLNIDGLNEARTAAMSLAAVHDPVAIAEANLDAASGVLGAAQALEVTQLQALVEFLNNQPAEGSGLTSAIAAGAVETDIREGLDLLTSMNCLGGIGTGNTSLLETSLFSEIRTTYADVPGISNVPEDMLTPELAFIIRTLSDTILQQYMSRTAVNHCYDYACQAPLPASDRYQIYQGYVTNWWAPVANWWNNSPSLFSQSDGGLFIYDTVSGTRLYINAQPLGLGLPPRIWCTVYDPDGYLWGQYNPPNYPGTQNN